MAMFEDILLESGHQIKTKSRYYTNRWVAAEWLASFGAHLVSTHLS